MIVKVCGVRTAEIAHVAIDAGADWIGVVLEPRSVRFARAADVVAVRRAVHGRAAVVGVVVDAPGIDLDALVAEHRLDAVQVHGMRLPAGVYSVPVIPALNPRSPLELADVDWPAAAPILLDAPPGADDGSLPGGTGRTVDRVAAAVLAAHRPVILAGGLGPDTVAAAMGSVRPWGVDASSGLESEPGVKDPRRVAAFVQAARAAAF